MVFLTRLDFSKSQKVAPDLSYSLFYPAALNFYLPIIDVARWFDVEESLSPTPTCNLKEELEEKKERIKKKLRLSESEKEEEVWSDIRQRKKVGWKYRCCGSGSALIWLSWIRIRVGYADPGA
jgi:hypothetical protein